jgi:ABC-type multidrug transport system permease subunit
VVEAALTVTGLQQHRRSLLLALPAGSWQQAAAAVALELVAGPDMLLVRDPLRRDMPVQGVQQLMACLRAVARSGGAGGAPLPVLVTSGDASTQTAWLRQHADVVVSPPALAAAPASASAASHIVPRSMAHTHAADARISWRAWLRLAGSGWTAPLPHRSFPVATALLIQRKLTEPLRKPGVLLGRYIIAPLFLTLFVGVLFWRYDDSGMMGAAARISLAFIGTVFACLINASNASGAAFAERHALYREVRQRMYSPEAWAIATVLSDALWSVIPAAIWVSLPFAMAGKLVPAEGGRLGELFVFTWGVLVSGGAMGMLSGNLGFHFLSVWVVEQLSLTLTSIMGGLFVPPSLMPRAWEWLHLIMGPARFLKSALAASTYCVEGQTADTCPTITLTAPGAATSRTITQYQYFSGRYSFDYEGRWEQYGYGVLIAACVVLLAAVAVRTLRGPWARWAAVVKRHHHAER